MKILKNVFVSILILFFFTNSSWSKSASEFISSLSIEASNILSSKLSDDEKIMRLKEIGEQSVDTSVYILWENIEKLLPIIKKNNMKNFSKIIF